MSEVKLKSVMAHSDYCGFYKCDGCYFNTDNRECPSNCELDKGFIFIIDEPQSPWVKIDDADLVEDEEYRFYTVDGEIELGTWCEVGFYDHETRKFKDVWMMESLYTCNGHTKDKITHVIHLPKPQTPKL